MRNFPDSGVLGFWEDSGRWIWTLLVVNERIHKTSLRFDNGDVTQNGYETELSGRIKFGCVADGRQYTCGFLLLKGPSGSLISMGL